MVDESWRKVRRTVPDVRTICRLDENSYGSISEFIQARDQGDWISHESD